MGVRLVIEDLEGSTTVVPLGNEEVTIGRKEHNTIQLTEQNVSRSHAKLTTAEDGWVIQDLESYNGVKVNGVPIPAPTLLREGDMVQIGDYHLTLTDDVDRAAFIDRPPRAANDDSSHIGMVGSSADLPSVSVEDLDPAPPPPGPSAAELAAEAAAAEEEEGKSKLGLIIGIIVAVLAIIAIVVVINGKSGNKGGDTKGKKPGDKVADKAGKNDSGAQPPAAGADAGAAADADAGPAADAGEIIEDGATADAGEIIEDGADDGAVKPVQKTPKKKKPKVDPEQALADARKAAMGGNASKAYRLARQSYSAKASSEALQLMGVQACKMGSSSKAKSAYKKMSGGSKDALKKVCATHGIDL